MQFYEMDLKVGSPYETWVDKMEPIHRGTEDDCQKCPKCGAAMGMLPWLPPYRATIRAYGKELGDVTFTGTDIVVSEKFRVAWTNAQLRGIDAFHPLERVRVRPARLGRKTPTYYFVKIQRFGTHVDLSRSLFEYAKPFHCTTCKDRVGVASVRGFKIDESTWTGEDLFIAWGLPGSIIVTDRVRQLRDDHDLKNMTLTPTEEFFWDPYNRWDVIDYSRDDGLEYEYEYVTEEDPPS